MAPMVFHGVSASVEVFGCIHWLLGTGCMEEADHNEEVLHILGQKQDKY